MPNTQIQLKNWELTLSCNVCNNHEEIIKELNLIASRWCFQKEDSRLYNEDENLSIGDDGSVYSNSDIDSDIDITGDDIDADKMMKEFLPDENAVLSDCDTDISDIDDEPDSDFFNSDNESEATFSDEENELDGYIHFQISLVLFKRKRKSELLKMLNQGDFYLRKAHISPANNNIVNDKDAFYCMKQDTRIDGPWNNRDYEEPIPIPKQISHIQYETLKPFQKEIILRSKYPLSNRSLNILVDKGGGIGKTTLLTYCLTHKEELGLTTKYIPMCESYKDVMGAVYGMGTADLYIVDLPRAIEKNTKSVRGLMAGLENVRNGIIHDQRFYWKSRVQDTAEIWAFSNTDFKNNKHLLSQDRWIFWQVGEDDELYLYPSGEKGLPIPIPESDEEWEEDEENYSDIDIEIDGKWKLTDDTDEDEFDNIVMQINTMDTSGNKVEPDTPNSVLQHTDVAEPNPSPEI